jgi:outer membrane protein assembly factor BamB
MSTKQNLDIIIIRNSSMSEPHHSPTRNLSKSNLLLFLLLAGIVIMAILILLLTRQSQPQKIIRDISNKTSDKLTLQATYTFDAPIGVLVADNEIMYFISEDTLISRDIDSEKMNWQYSSNGFELKGARSIEVDENNVYILTVTHITAFDKKTGSKIWSKKIGVGHVETILRILGQSIWVYYGDEIFLIDPSTGSITNKLERKNILWQNEQVKILEKNSSAIAGYDIASKLVLWENRDVPFRLDRYFFPILINKSEIIIRTPRLGICLLNILDGVYLWCRNEFYLSNVGIDDSRNLAYAIRDDYALVAIDIKTGKIIDEVFFEPSELPQELQPYLFDYFVAVDSSKVIIYFGDSNQIFVLR